VPSVSGNAALDVLIGLFFLYFLLSIVCSSINEGIASVFRLRAAYLERGIRVLLADPAKAKEFYAHWRMQSLIKPPGLIFKSPRKPSYIPSRVFALTLLDTFAPPAGGAPDDLVARAKAALGPQATGTGLNETVRGLLQDALTEADDNAARFRAALERSFDDVMDRASGWYKRKVQLILLGLALALVGGINADSFALGQRLWKDDALRSAVVAQAQTAVASGQQGCGKLIGLLVTAFALTLGAPFWFDLLGKVAHLRGSGPPTPGTQPSPA
jgi:hypothetical protein